MCLGILLPAMVLMATLKLSDKDILPTAPPAAPSTQPSAAPPFSNAGYQICVYFGQEQKMMDMEDYLVGVVLAEMPASFQMEALKAQAVAARTYTIRRSNENSRHGHGTICTDHTCCQAYIDPQEYVENGGSGNAVDRVTRAVADTAGEVLVYDEELIMATYFSCAGGITEDAVAVWGQDVPYLQSVISPGEESAPVYSDRKIFTPEDLQTLLGIRLKGDPDDWFTHVTYTPGGGVDTLTIGNIPYRGTTLRTLLGLRSTIFTVSVENGKIIFLTRGFGHRVGMSQYGANAMASAGKNYKEILQHYYTGTEIVQYFDYRAGNL